jgi:alcohol dehydrogenase class IV
MPILSCNTERRGIISGRAIRVCIAFQQQFTGKSMAILPHGMAANIRADAAPERYREIAASLTGNENASAEDGVAWVRSLAASLGISGLAKYGIGTAHIEDIVAKAAKASSMKANPVQLPADELKRVLEESL